MIERNDMVFYSRFRGKEAFDKAVTALFLLYCNVNVFAHFIVEMVGGFGNIIVIYLFALYFAFVYGEPIAKRKFKILYISLCVFLLIYILEMQFFYNQARFYNALGINFETHVWNLISFVPLSLCAVFIVQKTTVEMVSWIRRIFICTLLITLIPSLIMLVSDTTLAKQSATGNGEYIPFLVNYSIVYGLSIIVPYFFFSSDSKHRLCRYAVGLTAIVCICMSSFFIAIMTTFLAVFICLILRVKNKVFRHGLMFLSVASIFVFLYTDAAYNVLTRISLNLSSGLIKTRVAQLAAFLNTGVTGDTTARIDLYKGAFKLVLKHPIIGNILFNSEAKLSGHSEFLDVWGGCGAIAIMSLLSFFTSIYNMNKSFFEKGNASAAYKASTLAFLFVSLLNPIFSSPTICVFWVLAPLLLAPSER